MVPVSPGTSRALRVARAAYLHLPVKAVPARTDNCTASLPTLARYPPPPPRRHRRGLIAIAEGAGSCCPPLGSSLLPFHHLFPLVHLPRRAGGRFDDECRQRRLRECSRAKRGKKRRLWKGGTIRLYHEPLQHLALIGQSGFFLSPTLEIVS